MESARMRGPVRRSRPRSVGQRGGPMSPTPASALILLSTAAALAACQPTFDEIASGFAIKPEIRPAISQDGTVLAAEATRLLVGDGTTLEAVDLAPLGLTVATMGSTQSTMGVQIRDAGDLVFVAER